MAAPEDQAASGENSSPGGCPVEMARNKPCGRPIHPAPVCDPTPLCLMHSRDPKKSEEAFQEEFEAILKSAGDGVAKCTGFVFPCSNFNERKFRAACVFDGAVFTRYADFMGATFTQDAYFSGATFTEGVNFIGATFALGAHFSGAMFTQIAEFTAATFTKVAYFRSASFTQDAYFDITTFTWNADFIDTEFTKAAVFSSAMFAQDGDFSGATFTRVANFNSATFAQKVKFSGAKFLGPAEFRKTGFRQDLKLLPGPSFSLADFGQPEAVIFYKTHLGQALFHNCDVSKVTFSSVEWGEREGKRMVFEEEVDLEAAEDLRPAKDSPDERDYGLIAELYQRLKKNYDERKDYWTAGDFHYGEMETKRLATPRAERLARFFGGLKLRVPDTIRIEPIEKVVHRVRRGWHRQLSLVAWYRWASEYGESYARPALWLATILFAFALLYPVAGLHYDSAKDPNAVSGAGQTCKVLTYWCPFPPGQEGSGQHKAQWRLFGHSCVTALDVATFQRDRTYEPVYPWGRLLFLLEILLVPTLFGLFLLAVQRQFRR
jgi:uncharacterized protein YjbI with pentapeptide repeats